MYQIMKNKLIQDNLDNTLILENYSDKTFDFKQLLKNKESIIIKNCNNMVIIVNSKINKIIIERSKNINLTVVNTISGIDIDLCDNVTIKSYLPLNIVDCYKSNICFINNSVKEQPLKIINNRSQILFEYEKY